MHPKIKAASLTSLLVALALLPAGGAASQEDLEAEGEQAGQDLPAKSEGPVSFTVDTGVFFEDVGPPIVEVYLEASYDDLSFVHRAGGYVSQLEVVAIFSNRTGDQVGGDSWSRDIWVKGYDETIDPDNTYRAVAKFTIPPGEYDLKLTCGGRGSSLHGVARRRFKVPEPPSEGLRLSDIKIGLAGEGDSTAAGDPQSFVPCATRTFGEETPAVGALVEAYSFQGVESDSLRVDASARDENGRMAWGRSMTLARSGWETPLTLSVPMDSLSWGVYRLSLSVSAGDYEAGAERSFEVDETRVGVSMDADEFMDLMSLVATQEELETLASLGGSERRAYLEDIWKKRDPDRSTPRNEFKTLFFKRVKYAKKNYMELGREGWQTDRGRVFIKNGPPDRIDVRGGVIGSLSPDARLEIWYYDGTNTHYVFEDFGGSGQYTLVDVVQG